MKKITLLFSVILIIAATNGFSQKYTKPSDTLRLNQEYLQVTSEIAQLSSKLTIAQNNLPGYDSRADKATSNAQASAQASNDMASTATDGSIKDARREKKRANTALHKAKYARHANNEEKDQKKKIASLSAQLEKKQQRMQQLDAMRSNIKAQQ